MQLLCLWFGSPLLGRSRMVGNSLHFVLVHCLRAFASKAGSSRNDPILRGLASRASGPNFDPARINSLLGFAARQISLRIDGAFARQILALLGWLSIPDDDQPGIWIVLQTRSDVIEDGLAGVVHTPRLPLIREVALAQLAGLWRRWRRSFNRDLSGNGTGQIPRIGTSRIHGDGTGRSSVGLQGCGIAFAGDGSAG